MLLFLVRILCYGALIVVGLAAVINVVLDITNACPNLNETGLHCRVRALEGIGNVALGIVLASLLTVAPTVLAIAGLIFGVVDLVRWRRRRATR